MRRLTDAVLAGAHDDSIEGVDVVARPALEAGVDDVLAADGILLGSPANFGYMSGALKHFFDTVFLQAGGALSDDGSGDGSGNGSGSGSGATASGGKIPYGLWVHGRYDTTGATRSVQSIAQALPWVQSAAVLEVIGEVGDDEIAAGYELGGTLAALL